MYLKVGLLAMIVGAGLWSPHAVSALVVGNGSIGANEQSIPFGVESGGDLVVRVSSKGNSISGPIRDPFVGTFSGECGSQVQCVVDVDAVDKVYILELRVSHWQNADEVVCRLSGNMHLSKDKQYLAGEMGSSPLSGVFLRGAGKLELHDMPDSDCSQPFALDGLYRILGE